NQTANSGPVTHELGRGATQASGPGARREHTLQLVVPRPFVCRFRLPEGVVRSPTAGSRGRRRAWTPSARTGGTGGALPHGCSRQFATVGKPRALQLAV